MLMHDNIWICRPWGKKQPGGAADASIDVPPSYEDVMAQLRKQADKARQRAQERVRLGESEMGCSA